MPKEPQRLRITCPFGELGDGDADKGAGDQRASQIRAARGVSTRLGMHLGPCLDVDLPKLSVIQQTLIHRSPPSMRITAAKLVPMPAGMASGWSRRRLRVEAPIGP